MQVDAAFSTNELLARLRVIAGQAGLEPTTFQSTAGCSNQVYVSRIRRGAEPPREDQISCVVQHIIHLFRSSRRPCKSMKRAGRSRP